MSHSLLKIRIHGVFSTKDRMALITSEFEKDLYNHIKQKLENDLDCIVRIVNGMSDHIHILFLLLPKFCIGDIFKNLKVNHLTG